MNDPKDAIKSLKNAAVSAPDAGEIQAEVCQLASRAGDTETAIAAGVSAIQAFNSELSVNPLSVPAHQGLVRCYHVLYAEQSAKLSKNPNDGDSFVEGAKLLRAIAGLEQRIRLLDSRALMLQALEANKDNAEWQLFAAELEMDLGARTEAAARIDAVLQSDGNNASAIALKNRLNASAG